MLAVPYRFSDDLLHPRVQRVAGAIGGVKVAMPHDMLRIQRHIVGRGKDGQQHGAGLDLRRRGLLPAEVPAEGDADDEIRFFALIFIFALCVIALKA